jgi:hypothetical protein
MSQLPNIRPSLLLDFANTRSLDPLVTFTRASGGTHFNAQGLLVTAGDHRPRFDHDPVTGQSLGLLVEESRTNLLLRSEEFNDAYWTKTDVTITANSTTAPDGAITAEKAVATTTNTSHQVYATNHLVQNVTLTFSMFVKAAEYSRFVLSISNFVNHSASIRFNLVSGTGENVTVGSTDYSNVSFSLTPVGGGWFRAVITVTKGSQNNNNFAIFQILDNVNAGVFAGDGTSGIFIWGAQLEAGAFPTSYVRTVDAQVTRAADVASITGSNFSGWNNAAGGTILARYSAGGWKTNNTPPTDPLNLRKDVSDYSTDITDRVRRMMFYPRQLTADQITAITA